MAFLKSFWVLFTLLFFYYSTAAEGTPPKNAGKASVNSQEVEGKGFISDWDPRAKDYAYISSEAIWVWPTDATSKIIYVCWENPSKNNELGRGLVKSAIEESWQAHSQLRFQGWQACASDNRGIRILIADEGPHTKGLGRQIDGKKNGMVLNFTFIDWHEPNKPNPCATNQEERDSCIRSIAVHEFGHAIGWSHEQNRWDAPGECQKLSQGPNGDKMLTPYDKKSVMNYCNKLYNNDGQLSDLDQKALASIYGTP